MGLSIRYVVKEAGRFVRREVVGLFRPVYRLNRDEIATLQNNRVHPSALFGLDWLGEARQRAVGLEKKYFQDLEFNKVLEELKGNSGTREYKLKQKLEQDGIQSYRAAVDFCKEHHDVNALILAAAKAVLKQLTYTWNDDRGFGYTRPVHPKGFTHENANLNKMSYEEAIDMAINDIKMFSKEAHRQKRFILRHATCAK